MTSCLYYFKADSNVEITRQLCLINHVTWNLVNCILQYFQGTFQKSIAKHAILLIIIRPGLDYNSIMSLKLFKAGLSTLNNDIQVECLDNSTNCSLAMVYLNVTLWYASLH